MLIFYLLFGGVLSLFSKHPFTHTFRQERVWEMQKIRFDFGPPFSPNKLTLLSHTGGLSQKKRTLSYTQVSHKKMLLQTAGLSHTGGLSRRRVVTHRRALAQNLPISILDAAAGPLNYFVIAGGFWAYSQNSCLKHSLKG